MSRVHKKTVREIRAFIARLDIRQLEQEVELDKTTNLIEKSAIMSNLYAMEQQRKALWWVLGVQP